MQRSSSFSSEGDRSRRRQRRSSRSRGGSGGGFSAAVAKLGTPADKMSEEIMGRIVGRLRQVAASGEWAHFIDEKGQSLYKNVLSGVVQSDRPYAFAKEQKKQYAD